MEKYLIDYEIDREKEAEKEPEKGPVMDYDERKEEKSQEEKEREEKAKKAANKANYAWQAKEYEQINVKLPRGLKKAFLLACREKGVSGRQYIIDSMRQLIDTEIGHWDI
jgi:CRISPR/Cas system CSM-associated protein Csm4 (group 5 of RAMP superfamily)